jgi:hypothetical protein
VKLEDQWREIEAELQADWVAARLDVVVETASERPRAAALLGPANPGRMGNALRVEARRGGGGIGPEGLRRLFRRLDEARIWSSLRLVDVTRAAEVEERAGASPAEGWDALLATLPPDWSDLHVELRLHSSDHLDRAALLCAPLNPTRAEGLAFRCRVARRFGYGASPEMVRRCMERLHAERIPADLDLLRILSETDNVATQGPVFRVGGKSV